MAMSRRILIVLALVSRWSAGASVAAFGVLPPDGLRGIKAFAPMSVCPLAFEKRRNPDQSGVAEAAAKITVSDNDCAANDDCGGLDTSRQILTSKSGLCCISGRPCSGRSTDSRPSIDLHCGDVPRLEIGLAARIVHSQRYRLPQISGVASASAGGRRIGDVILFRHPSTTGSVAGGPNRLLGAGRLYGTCNLTEDDCSIMSP
jgi:hypothetical protein